MGDAQLIGCVLEGGLLLAVDRRVSRSVSLPAGPADVWAAFADASLFGEWFGGEVVELELRPGGRLAVRSPDGELRRALVEEVAPGQRLRFRWLPVVELPSGSLVWVQRSTVSVTLVASGDGTELRVVEE